MNQIHIQRVLDFIESHLNEKLDNATLARVAGYSEFHFLRVFRKAIHLTPADYIRKRRISEIVLRIGATNRPISDIAFEYGFNSKENFIRAFKKEHSILPSEFKAANCSLRLFQPFTFQSNVPSLQAAVKFMKGFTLIAYPCDEVSPPNFWNKYNAEKRSLRLSGGTVAEDFGAMRWNSEKGRLDYYIGIRAEDVRGDTADTTKLEISEGLYAIFDTPFAEQHNFVGIIRDSWKWIYQEWLPKRLSQNKRI